MNIVRKNGSGGVAEYLRVRELEEWNQISFVDWKLRQLQKRAERAAWRQALAELRDFRRSLKGLRP